MRSPAVAQVLAEEPQNAKALFRRGRARHQLGQTEAALEDLTKARQAAPSDANIARELQAVRTVIQQVRLFGIPWQRSLQMCMLAAGQG